MTRQEMIEKLKQNERPFGLLSEEERDFLYSIPITSLEVFTDKGVWERRRYCSVLFCDIVVRINTNYEENIGDGEYEVLPITTINLDGVERFCFFKAGIGALSLHEALSMPKFAGVQFAGQDNLDLWYLYLRGYLSASKNMFEFMDKGSMRSATPIRIRFEK